eukprot:COSAG06_NODE_53943_length_297_cov_0.782828_1_plen_51_part_10
MLISLICVLHLVARLPQKLDLLGQPSAVVRKNQPVIAVLLSQVIELDRVLE